jgi:hypothetical protein
MRELEVSISEAIATRLIEWSALLASSGLTFRGPEIDVEVANSEMYTSEMRVTFLRFGNIDDVLEFHIYRDGKALVTVEEVLKWFDEQLAEIEDERGRS